jgi:hypothetical protein
MLYLFFHVGNGPFSFPFEIIHYSHDTFLKQWLYVQEGFFRPVLYSSIASEPAGEKSPQVLSRADPRAQSLPGLDCL